MTNTTAAEFGSCAEPKDPKTTLLVCLVLSVFLRRCVTSARARPGPKAEAGRWCRPAAPRTGGAFFLGPPKSAAGRRQVVFPDVIVPDLREHLAQYAQPEADGFVFTSPGSVQLRQSNFRRRVWAPTLAKVRLPGVRFHDLRRTGNTLTAGADANLRELMERMGHSSARAAMIYLHNRRTAAYDR